MLTLFGFRGSKRAVLNLNKVAEHEGIRSEYLCSGAVRFCFEKAPVLNLNRGTEHVRTMFGLSERTTPPSLEGVFGDCSVRCSDPQAGKEEIAMATSEIVREKAIDELCGRLELASVILHVRHRGEWERCKHLSCQADRAAIAAVQPKARGDAVTEGSSRVSLAEVEGFFNQLLNPGPPPSKRARA